MGTIQVETANPLEAAFNPEIPPEITPDQLLRVDREISLSQKARLYDPEGKGLSGVNRLVVLVPDQDVDTVALAQQLWPVANPGRLAVILVTTVPNPDYYAAAQRRLSAIAAITRDRRVKVDTAVIQGKNWIQAVQSLWHPTDLIVCHAEQKATGLFSRKQSLAEKLATGFHRPVLIFSGLYPEIKVARSKWLMQIPYWLILLTIIAGFFIFESRVDQAGSSWVEKTLFALLFLLEVGLIWGWNAIMG